MAYRPNSLWSSNSNLEGLNLRICRHNSLPMEPPAPVTSTCLPLIQRVSKSARGGTASRPNKSSMATSLISSRRALPLAISANDGTVCTCTFSVSSQRTTAILVARLSDGSASSTVRIAPRSTAFSKARRPTTGTPQSSVPCLPTASSTIISGCNSAVDSSPDTSCAPAPPAPKTATASRSIRLPST